MQIIILYISGSIDTHLTKEHKKEIKRFIYNHQVRIILRTFIIVFQFIENILFNGGIVLIFLE